jgi:hypothetical protein
VKVATALKLTETLQRYRRRLNAEREKVRGTWKYDTFTDEIDEIDGLIEEISNARVDTRGTDA